MPQFSANMTVRRLTICETEQGGYPLSPCATKQRASCSLQRQPAICLKGPVKIQNMRDYSNMWMKPWGRGVPALCLRPLGLQGNANVISGSAALDPNPPPCCPAASLCRAGCADDGNRPAGSGAGRPARTEADAAARARSAAWPPLSCRPHGDRRERLSRAARYFVMASAQDPQDVYLQDSAGRAGIGGRCRSGGGHGRTVCSTRIAPTELAGFAPRTACRAEDWQGWST